MIIRPLVVIWRVVAIAVIFWIVTNFLILFVPVLKISSERDIQMDWILGEIIESYRNEINLDFGRNGILSHSFQSLSREFDQIGINESYSGVLTLVTKENENEKWVKCTWVLDVGENDIKVVEWENM